MRAQQAQYFVSMYRHAPIDPRPRTCSASVMRLVPSTNVARDGALPPLHHQTARNAALFFGTYKELATRQPVERSN